MSAELIERLKELERCLASDGMFENALDVGKAISALEAGHKYKAALEAIVYDDYHDNIAVAKIVAKQALLPAPPIVEQGEK